MNWSRAREPSHWLHIPVELRIPKQAAWLSNLANREEKSQRNVQVESPPVVVSYLLSTSPADLGVDSLAP